MFGLSAVKNTAGYFVPPHQAVIHSYMARAVCRLRSPDTRLRQPHALWCARHARHRRGRARALKQLVGETYDIDMPQVVAVMLRGSPRPGVGPHDVALAIIGAVFDKRYVTNKVMEFIGDGIANLPIEYRNGIDVMTTETTCLLRFG